MQDFLDKFKSKFLSLDQNLRVILSCAVLATMCALFFDFRSKESRSSDEQDMHQQSENLATFIPDGFTLIPIEIMNSSGMDSILGRYGTADLFREGEKTVFMTNVRLVRGIEENGPWAALVPDNYGPALLESGNRFFVAVKKSTSAETVMKSKTKNHKRTIVYKSE